MDFPVDFYCQTIQSIPSELHKPLHAIGFAIIFSLIYLTLSKVKLGPRFLLSITLCFIIAVVDESIRGFNIEDVLLDLFSSLLTYFAIIAWGKDL